MALPNDPLLGAAGSKSVAKALKISSYAVAGVPSAAGNPGRIIHVSNGAAGQPCLAYSNGTAWLRILMGVAVNASA